jgi:hypothetical protein
MILKKIKNRIFHRALGKLLLQGGGYYDNPTPRKRLLRAFNQYINEKGIATPFILSPGECVDFWKTLDNNSPSCGNRPETYAAKNNNIIYFLNKFWSPEITQKDSILELGCNCGANLHWLWMMGYRDLAGTDVNINAIKQMDLCFPYLRKSINLKIGDIGTVLRKFPCSDVIFTMGVSMHIHPQRNFIFEEMRRVAKKYIVTIEPEPANSNYVFARNYRRVFEKMGCVQIKSVRVDALDGLDIYHDCIARLIKLK